jgi:hypothetical protein
MDHTNCLQVAIKTLQFNGCRCNERLIDTRRNLNSSDTLGDAGRKNSKPNIGIHGQAGGTRPGQTRKTPKNLSAHESDERGREESVGLYDV